MTDIHEIVRQLCDWHTNRQPYKFEGDMSSWDTQHITQVPPLLTQLAEAAPASTGSSQQTTPGSRPAARIEALDTLIHIDNAAARWVRDLGEDDPGNTVACVRKVYSLAASAQFCGRTKATIEDRKVICCTVHAIERDIRTWWTQARLISGWDTAAWAPNNTCPLCGERRTLRVRADDQSAMCTGCRSTWEKGNIGLLADHIRKENGDEARELDMTQAGYGQHAGLA